MNKKVEMLMIRDYITKNYSREICTRILSCYSKVSLENGDNISPFLNELAEFIVTLIKENGIFDYDLISDLQYLEGADYSIRHEAMITNAEKNWFDTHTDSVPIIKSSLIENSKRCFAFSAKYLLQDDSNEEDNNKQEVEEKSNSKVKYDTVREQFIEDIKIAIKDDKYVQQSYINYLDSLPTVEKKYEFLIDVYQHYFDYFVRDKSNN
jgi:hypothetical protein